MRCSLLRLGLLGVLALLNAIALPRNTRAVTGAVEPASDTSIPLSVSVPSGVMVGETFDVFVEIGSASSPASDVFGLSASLTYDAASLSLISDSPGGFWTGSPLYIGIPDGPGRFGFGITNTLGQPGLSGMGEVLHLQFTVAAGVSDGAILEFGLEEVDAQNSSGASIETQPSGGSTVVVGNRAPETADDSYQVSEDEVLAVAAPGLLQNDSDPDGDTITASVVSVPTNGSFTLDADGGFLYAPSSNFFGADSLVYEATDGQGASRSTVRFTINPVNDAPVASDLSASVDENGEVVMTLSAVDPDGDSLIFFIESAPQNGTATTNNGTATYRPSPDFSGTDTFTFRANDGVTDSNLGTVSVEVVPDTSIPLSVSVPSGVMVGETFDVFVEIGSASSPASDVFGLSASLTYDAASLSLISDSPGGFWTGSPLYIGIPDGPGRFGFGITNTLGQPGLSGMGEVLHLQFTVAAGVSDGAILEFGLEEVDAQNSSGASIEISSDDTATATVAINLAPLATIRASLTVGQAPISVRFDAGESTDPNGDSLLYAWDFGDGQAGSGVAITHTYATAGSFTATVEVSDGSLTDQASVAIEVASGVDVDAHVLPAVHTLGAPYPNPSRSVAKVDFGIPTESVVRIVLIDMLGRTASVVLDHARYPAGWHQASIDVGGMPSGLYVINLFAGGRIRSTRPVLVY